MTIRKRFCFLIVSVTTGHINQIRVWAWNHEEAKALAYRVACVIDRNSIISPGYEEGKKDEPVKLKSEVLHCISRVSEEAGRETANLKIGDAHGTTDSSD